MSTSRTVKLYALTKTIKLQQYRREAAKLFGEIDRINKRLVQLVELRQGYADHLGLPELTPMEVRGALHIAGMLDERKSVDEARRDLLEGERSRLANLLIEKKREIEKLEEEELRLKRLERQERQERQDALMPTRRS
jgi:DNA repair exonuclease SbcCD ATPase subunit